MKIRKNKKVLNFLKKFKEGKVFDTNYDAYKITKIFVENNQKFIRFVSVRNSNDCTTKSINTIMTWYKEGVIKNVR